MTIRQDLRRVLGCHPADNSPHADNLAIVLCTYFEDHQDRPAADPETENGWGEWVERQADRVLDELCDQIIKTFTLTVGDNRG